MLSEMEEKMIIGGVVLVLISGVVYYIYTTGKKAGTRPQTKPLPYDDRPGQSGQTNVPDTAEAEKIADAIYEEFSGLNFSTNEEVLKDFLILNSTDFVQTYNVWNSKYSEEENETMREFISDQWALPGTVLAELKETILNRMSTLNLA